MVFSGTPSLGLVSYKKITVYYLQTYITLIKYHFGFKSLIKTKLRIFNKKENTFHHISQVTHSINKKIYIYLIG